MRCWTESAASEGRRAPFLPSTSEDDCAPRRGAARSGVPGTELAAGAIVAVVVVDRVERRGRGLAEDRLARDHAVRALVLERALRNDGDAVRGRARRGGGVDDEGGQGR